MSGSVWYPQVNKALKDLIPTIVKRYNKEGILVAVPTFVRTPESEFKSEKYPAVTISSYDESFANYRYDERKVIVSKDLETGIGILEDGAKPYDLYYQIDFWAQYQEDIEEMVRRWCEKFVKFNVLQVKDSLSNTRNCLMQLLDIGKADIVKNKDERIFHRIYSYLICVELDEGGTSEVKLVLERDIINKGGVPT